MLAQDVGNHELFLDDRDCQVFVEYLARLMTTATTWDEFKTIPKDEKLKTIKQLNGLNGLYGYITTTNFTNITNLFIDHK